MVNKFDGPSWIAGSKRLDELREQWEKDTFAAHQVAMGPKVGSGSTNPMDVAVATQTEALKFEWYDAIGNMGVKMGSDASKMNATGTDYSATEQAATAANERFWKI